MKIETAFLCDDFRKEDNGKLLFIGVYGGDIALSQAPVAGHPLALQLSLVFSGEFSGVEKIEIEISLNDRTILKGTLSINALPSSYSFVPVPLAPLVIPEIGWLRIKTKLQSGKWKLLREIEIKAPNPSPPTSA